MADEKHILIYGKNGEHDRIIEILKEIYIFGRDNQYHCVNNCEEFQLKMIDLSPRLAIIIQNGAAGMEGAYIAKKTNPDVPLFWFSDDGDFAMQSYRLECEYFAVKPVTKDKILHGLNRCAHLGIV